MLIFKSLLGLQFLKEIWLRLERVFEDNNFMWKLAAGLWNYPDNSAKVSVNAFFIMIYIISRILCDNQIKFMTQSSKYSKVYYVSFTNEYRV